MGSVTAVSARVVVEYCEALGFDGDALLCAADLDRHALSPADARVPSARIAQLWRHAYELTGDAALGLHVAESVQPGTYRVLHFLGANAPTVGEAFERICAYIRCADDTLDLRVVEEADGFGLALGPAVAEACGARVHAEYVFAVCYLGTRRATKPQFAPRCLELSAAAPADAAERERVFGCPVSFGRAHDRLWFDREAWKQPLHGSDARLLGVLETHARMLLAGLPDEPELVQAVRRVVDRRLACATPTVQQVAAELGTSVRALQRALADTGTSFSQVLDNSRIAAARSLLADRSLSLSDVALRLGYSEQSAFTRAYKRWTGVAPIQVRARTGRGLEEERARTASPIRRSQARVAGARHGNATDGDATE